jgi:membrane protease YdiL (CAAX protease family)
MASGPSTAGAGRARFELAFVLACTLAAEWAVLPLFGRSALAFGVPTLAALAFMFVSHRRRGEGARRLGFGLDNFPRSLLLLAPPMAVCAASLYAGGRLLWGAGPARFRPGWGLAAALFWLFLWGLLQQYALQAFINRRAQELWGAGARSVVFTAVVFALLHAPNLWLMLATFAGGLLWAWVYQRAPNLFALALSHCLMTVALVSTVPNSLLHGMRVGAGYFR